MLTTEKLKRILLIVSIITITILGLYLTKLFADQVLSRFISAAKAVIIPFAIAFFLSFLIGPLAKWMEARLKIKRSLAIPLAIAIGVTGLLLIITVSVAFLVSEMTSIIRSSLNAISDQGVMDLINAALQQFESQFADVDMDQIVSAINGSGLSLSVLAGILSQSIVFIMVLFQSLFSAFFTVLLTPVFLYYLVKEKSTIFNEISMLAPTKIRVHVVELGRRGNDVIGHYFKGQGVMMTLIFVFFAVTLTILSFFIPNFTVFHALLFALLMGLFAIVPYVGAWIGLALPVLFLFSNRLDAIDVGQDGRIFVIAIIIVVILQIVEQVIESSIVSPMVMGKEVKIHPLAVLSAFIFFGGLFGFVGVLLAVPMAGMTKAIISYLFELKDKR